MDALRARPDLPQLRAAARASGLHRAAIVAMLCDASPALKWRVVVSVFLFCFFAALSRN